MNLQSKICMFKNNSEKNKDNVIYDYVELQKQHFKEFYNLQKLSTNLKN